MKNKILAIFLLIIIGLGMIFYMSYQFKIYQKKYGEKMNFIDFLFDAKK